MNKTFCTYKAYIKGKETTVKQSNKQLSTYKVVLKLAEKNKDQVDRESWNMGGQNGMMTLEWRP